MSCMTYWANFSACILVWERILLLFPNIILFLQHIIKLHSDNIKYLLIAYIGTRTEGIWIQCTVLNSHLLCRNRTGASKLLGVLHISYGLPQCNKLWTWLKAWLWILAFVRWCLMHGEHWFCKVIRDVACLSVNRARWIIFWSLTLRQG